MTRSAFDFRRDLTTMTFCASGLVLVPLLAWIIHLLADRPAALERIAMGLILIIFVVVIGLAMTVSLRQVSARFANIDISASGGAEDDAAPAAAAIGVQS